MKFKVIEIKQKVEEEGKITKGVEAGMGIINSLAALGNAVGINTQFLSTLTGMVGNVKSIIKDAQTLWNIKKETKGLDSNTLNIADIIKNKKLYNDIANYVKATITSKRQLNPQSENKPLSDKEFQRQLSQVKKERGVKEALSLKHPTERRWLNPNEFLQGLQNITADIKILDSKQNVTKATNLTKEQLQPIIDKMVQTFVRNYGYDNLIKLAKTNNLTNFTNLFSQEFEKFLHSLSPSKNEDTYYAKFGNSSEYMKDSDDKIWNNSMSDKERQDWARVWLGLKPTSAITPGAAEKLYKFRYQMMREGKSEIDEKDLNKALQELGIKEK